jgi:hypothetical protein
VSRNLEVDVADTERIRKSEEEIAELQLSITRSEAGIQVDALLNLSSPAVALNARLLKLEARLRLTKRSWSKPRVKIVISPTKPFFSPLSPQPKTWPLAPACAKRSAERWLGSIFGFVATGIPLILYPTRKTTYSPSLALPSPTVSSATLSCSKMGL